MSRFMSALSKIGLIELSEEERRAAERKAAAKSGAAPGDEAPASADEIDRILRETQEMLGASGGGSGAAPEVIHPTPPPPAAPPPDAPPPPPAGAVPPPALVEQRPLTQIYAEAGVPESPFPAEKMLKVLAGLKAMPVETRKAAILAMDAADDDWTIDDTILDAQRKTRALEAARAGLDAELERAEAAAAAELEARDSYREQATAEIRRQIAELEALLQEEINKVATEKATIQAGLQATREACAREAARYEQTIAELGEIPRTFGGD